METKNQPGLSDAGNTNSASVINIGTETRFAKNNETMQNNGGGDDDAPEINIPIPESPETGEKIPTMHAV